MSKWRDVNFQQPEGVYVLNSYFDKAEDLLSRMGLHEKLDFCFMSSSVANDIRRPSYNLVAGYGDHIILICYYELDQRFGLEVSEKEIIRIEDLLANMAVTALFTYGLAYCIKKAMKSQTAMTLTAKESDDKKFLPLN